MVAKSEFLIGDEEGTERFAVRLAPHLRADDVIFLQGDLGAGKTTLTRALVRALGSPAPVSSPTFTLIHEYPGGRVPIVHVDAYRLSGPDDVNAIGLTEYLERGDCVVIVEWPERIASAIPGDRLLIRLEEAGETARKLTVSAVGARWDPVLSALSSAENGAC